MMLRLALLALGVLEAAPISNHSFGLGALGPECSNYLSKKGFPNADALAGRFHRCTQNFGKQALYAPNPRPAIPGSSDTTNMACRYGNRCMKDGTACCGVKPHFNWVVSTCEHNTFTGQFCWNVPSCVLSGSPKINYVAAYQFDGNNFQLMDDSSVGEITNAGISGNWHLKTGWENAKHGFGWKGGDWSTKYAASARGNGPDGPRGVTPPAGMWVLSAENFYYGAFYMLSQLNINLAGHGYPGGENCWTWELDSVEGTAGWAPNKPTPGNLNQLYSTDNAQASGCMPISFWGNQANGLGKEFKFPEEFRQYCSEHPTADGCQPWAPGKDVSWSGGSRGSQRFENLWDEPYVFVIVVDAKGYWTYRWRPAALNDKTGWSGVERYNAARTLPPRPTPVRDPAGLRTDVDGSVVEAVILQPAMSPEGSCLRSSIEQVDWHFGAEALGSIAEELGQNVPGGQLEGAHNWWSYFVDTQQYANYPMSIAGVPSSELPRSYTCNTKDHFSCACRRGSAPPSPPPSPPPPTHTCNHACAFAGGTHTCHERVIYETDSLRKSLADAILVVGGQCKGQCACTAADFPAPKPSPPPPPPPSMCNHMCTFAGATHTCHERVIYERDSLRRSLADAIRNVQRQCVGQCACTSADMSGPYPEMFV